VIVVVAVETLAGGDACREFMAERITGALGVDLPVAALVATLISIENMAGSTARSPV